MKRLSEQVGKRDGLQGALAFLLEGYGGSLCGDDFCVARSGASSLTGVEPLPGLPALFGWPVPLHLLDDHQTS